MSRVARRHYRVAQKEIHQNQENAVLIPKKRKGLFVGIISAASAIALLVGIIIGFVICDSRKDD